MMALATSENVAIHWILFTVIATFPDVTNTC